MKRLFGNRSDKRIDELTKEVEQLKEELKRAQGTITQMQSKSQSPNRSLATSPRLAGNESDENPIILPTNGWDNEVQV